VVVRRPREEVFAFLADAENDPQWRPGVLDISRVSGEGVGTLYRQGVKGPMGKRVPADIQVTELRPNDVIAFRAVEGPVRPNGRYELSPEDGATRVRFSLDAEVGGLKRLMAPMVQKQMDREVSNLDRLKQVLESG
jgi:carbon monoxide dehydrogenase subunit G